MTPALYTVGTGTSGARPPPEESVVVRGRFIPLACLAALACAVSGPACSRSFDVERRETPVHVWLTAPALAWLNHRAILGPEVPEEHRPGRRMVAYSWAGIVFTGGFALYYLYRLVF